MKTQGLSHNLPQFLLLVLINAFVGGMLGLERSIFPVYANTLFQKDVGFSMLLFIVFFGISKSIANYLSGVLSLKFRRKPLVLIGWLFALPVPWILMFTHQWEMVWVANILLGINQGLCWSGTVVMKIDLVGQKQRGLAMGLNEFAGYLSVAFFGFFSGYLASEYGVRTAPFIPGVALSILGLLVTLIWIEDTTHWVKKEQASSIVEPMRGLFWNTTWKNKTLGSVTQAGLVNNLNDGMVWGLMPALLISQQYTLKEVGLVAGIYPAVWGIAQIGTGWISDKMNHKTLLTTGMLLQGGVFVGMAYAHAFGIWIFLAALLGLGTALVYPVFLVMISKYTTPQQRAGALGIFRFWRDLGYALGALLSALVVGLFSIQAAIILTGFITFLSGIILMLRIPNKKAMQ